MSLYIFQTYSMYTTPRQVPLFGAHTQVTEMNVTDMIPAVTELQLNGGERDSQTHNIKLHTQRILTEHLQWVRYRYVMNRPMSLLL